MFLPSKTPETSVETYFGPMGSQKSAILLNKLADYRRLNLPVLVMKPEIDTKTGSLIGSRTGQEAAPDFLIPQDIDPQAMADELYLQHRDARANSNHELTELLSRLDQHRLKKIRSQLGESTLRSAGLRHIFVDEAQFGRPDILSTIVSFSKDQGVPVDFYAIRTDFRNVLFDGSAFLDRVPGNKVHELHGACRCGGKTVLNARKINGKFVFDGDQVAMDGQGDVTYESLCDDCYTLERQEVEPFYVHSRPIRPSRRQSKLTLVLGADESINSEVVHAITRSRDGAKMTSHTPSYARTPSYEDMGSPQLIDATLIDDIEYFRKDPDIAFQKDIETLLKTSDVITANSSLATRLAHFAMRTVIGEPRYLQPSEIIDEVNKITTQWLASNDRTPNNVMYLRTPVSSEQQPAQDPRHPAYNSPFYRDVYNKVLGEAARSIALNTPASVGIYDTSKLSVDGIRQKYLSDSNTVWFADGGIVEILPQY